MGLLEKAQEKKQKIEVIENEVLLQEKDELSKLKEDSDIDLKIDSDEDKKSEENLKEKINKSQFKKEIIEEKKGFGWKGMGSRRITYYHDINEYIYEVYEPVLNETEIEIKKVKNEKAGPQRS